MIPKTNSKKWVDYSDEDSSDDEQHQDEVKPKDNSKQSNKKEPIKCHVPSKEEIDRQLDRLDELDHNKIDEVWLLMTSQDELYLKKEMDYLKGKAQKKGNIVNVFPSKSDAGCYDVLVFIKIAYDYIELGYDSSNLMKVNVSERNFEKRSNERGKRRQSSYKQKSEKEGEKKKYVDKQTGKEPEAKKQFEEKIERVYSKEEAEKRGQGLGQFRNKPSKKQEGTEQNVPQQELKVSKKTSTETEPKDVEKTVEEKELKPKEVKKENTENKKGKVDDKKNKKAKVQKVKSLNPFEGIQSLD